MDMNETLCFYLQRTHQAAYMATYLSNHRESINASRRERYRRGKLREQLMAAEERKEKKRLNYYYRNHEKCKAKARQQARINYRKHRERILNRKRLKRAENRNKQVVENRKPEKVVVENRQAEKVENRKPEKVVIRINTWQMIPLIVTCNAQPEEKLAAIVHLL